MKSRRTLASICLAVGAGVNLWAGISELLDRAWALAGISFTFVALVAVAWAYLERLFTSLDLHVRKAQAEADRAEQTLAVLQSALKSGKVSVDVDVSRQPPSPRMH